MQSIFRSKRNVWSIGLYLIAISFISFIGAIHSHAAGDYIGMEIIKEIPFTPSAYGSRDFNITSDDTIGYRRR